MGSTSWPLCLFKLVVFLCSDGVTDDIPKTASRQKAANKVKNTTEHIVTKIVYTFHWQKHNTTNSDDTTAAHFHHESKSLPSKRHQNCKRHSSSACGAHEDLRLLLAPPISTFSNRGSYGALPELICSKPHPDTQAYAACPHTARYKWINLYILAYYNIRTFVGYFVRHISQ